MVLTQKWVSSENKLKTGVKDMNKDMGVRNGTKSEKSRRLAQKLEESQINELHEYMV